MCFRNQIKNIQMLKHNYYKIISVTQHDFNYVMGFIKEDEIYNQERDVRVLVELPSSFYNLI